MIRRSLKTFEHWPFLSRFAGRGQASPGLAPRLVLVVVWFLLAVNAGAQERGQVRTDVERMLRGIEMNVRAVVAPRIKSLARDVEALEADYRRYRDKLAALAPAIALGEALGGANTEAILLGNPISYVSEFLGVWEESLSELRVREDALVEHHRAMESFSKDLCRSADRPGTEGPRDLAAAAAARDAHLARQRRQRHTLPALDSALADVKEGRRSAERVLSGIRTVQVLTRNLSSTAIEPEAAWREIKADRENLASRREALVRDSAKIEEQRGREVESLNDVVDLIVSHPDYFEDFELERLQKRIQTYRKQLGPVPDVPDVPRRGGIFPVDTGDEVLLMTKAAIEEHIRTLARAGSLYPKGLRELETLSYRLAGSLEEAERLLSTPLPSVDDLVTARQRMQECLAHLERIARADPESDSAAPLADAGDPEAVPSGGGKDRDPADPGRTEADPEPPADRDFDAEETGEPDFGQAPPAADVASDAEETPSEESGAAEAPEDIPLPDVIGLKIDVAAQRIADAGLVPRPRLGGTAATEAQENTVEDAVPANTPLRKGDAVILKVWRAPVATGVVPAVEGLYVDEAYTAVEAAGLSPVIVVGEDTRQVDEVNRVYRQAPPAGSTVPEGATVKLTAYVADVPGRVVPRLTGMDVPTARALLDDRELILETEVVEPAGSLQTANTIARQYPEPGVEVPRGTGIRAYVFDEFEPPPPAARAPAGEDFGEASPRWSDPPPAEQDESSPSSRPDPAFRRARLEFLDVPTRFLFTKLQPGRLSGHSTRRIGASTLRIERPAGGWDGSSIDGLFYEAGRDQRGQHLSVTVVWRPVGWRPGDRFARLGAEHVGRPGEIGVTIGSMVGGVPPFDLIIQVTDPENFVKLEIHTPAGIHRFINLERLRSELRTFARKIFDQFNGIAKPR